MKRMTMSAHGGVIAVPGRALVATLCMLWGTDALHGRPVPWAAAVSADAAFGGASAVEAADIDRDGDLDLVGAAYEQDLVAWFENTAGDGSAWTRRTVATGFDGPRSVFPADIDGDGDVDIVGAAKLAGKVTWWENPGTVGPSWTEHAVGSAFGGAQNVRVADIDRDGDMDIVGAAFDGDLVAWFENTAGDGSAWTRTTIGTANGPYSCDVADLDGDGDPDVIAASVYDVNDVVWWENTAGDASAWTAHVVTAAFTNATWAAAADIDGDGDLDVAAANIFDDDVAWFENTAGDGSAWTRRDVDLSFADGYMVRPADIDIDGDTDLIAAASDDHDIAWYENTSGSGSAWTKRVVAGSFFKAYAVAAADVDGDGDPDLAGASFGATATQGTVAWWENTTIHRSAYFPIESGVDAAFSAEALTAADFDGDGDLDFAALAKAPGELPWWENTAGDGSAWARHVVATSASGRAACATDMDGDGDPDLVCANGKSLTLYRNAGSGGSWSAVTVDSDPTAFDVTSIQAADVDGDGDPDLVGTENAGHDVLWWKNNTGDASSWTRGTIAGSFAGAVSAAAADIDRDGDLDVIAAADTAGAVHWWANADGAGGSWTEHTVDAAFTRAAAVAAADFDSDGDYDILAASATRLTWWENTADDGTSWTEREIDSSLQDARTVKAVDFDQDGDLDVLAAAAGADGVTWWENVSGDGRTLKRHAVEGTTGGALCVAAADVDGDGDLDIAGGKPAAPAAISWWSNRGGQFSLATTGLGPTQAPAGDTVELMSFTLVHRGRASDTDEELSSVHLLFENAPGEPADAGINTLMDVLSLYVDDGSGDFDPGADSLVAEMDVLAPSSGVVTLPAPDGAAGARVTAGNERLFFLATTFHSDAHMQDPSHFTVTHITASTSTAEDRDNDIPLALEYAPDTASGAFTAVCAADIVVSKTQQTAIVLPGRALRYTVTVSNDDDCDALDVEVADTLPDEIAGASWVCSAQGLAACGGTSGSGDIADTADLPAGSSVTYTIDGTLQSAFPMINTAAAVPPADVTDPEPANNTATARNAPRNMFLPYAVAD